MSCALTQGYTLDCRDNVGGVVAVYITEHGNVASTNISTGSVYNATGNNPTGTITTITMASTKVWRKYEMVKESAKFEEKPTMSVENGTIYHEQDIDIQIRKLITNWRNEIYLLAQNRVDIIVQDRNGRFWYCGYNNGCDAQTSTQGAGQKMADFNGYKLKFKGMEEFPAIEITATQAYLNALTA